MSDDPACKLAALAYAAMGWPVIPVHSIRDGQCTCGNPKCPKPGKHPATRNGSRNAATDPIVIREWWRSMPWANVAVCTGALENGTHLVAVDVDPRHNGDVSLSEIVAEFGVLDRTPVAITGGGGAHVIYASNAPIANSEGAIADGIDVRGTGGYIVVSPSLHESGSRYSWQDDAHPTDTPVAPMPPWVTRKRPKPVPSVVASQTIAPTQSGSRNSDLTRVAGAMRRVGLSESRILEVLSAENVARYNPPLGADELATIARSVARYVPDVEEEPFRLMSRETMLAPLPPVVWTVEGLGIAPGAVTLIGGAGFSGKTMCLQAALLSIAAGRSVWGRYPSDMGTVLHLDYEQGPRVTLERYKRQANGMGIPLESVVDRLRLACLPKRKLCHPKAEEELYALCDGVRIAIVDAFRGAFPSAKENDSEARQYLDMLQVVSDKTGCAMLVIAHSKKANGEGDSRSQLRGSSALFDAAQTVYMIEGHKGHPSRVVNEKDRILGMTRKTFGLRIVDVPDGEDLRWGIDVEYVDPSELTEPKTREQNDDMVIAENVARLTSLGNRILELVNNGHDVTHSMLVGMTKGSATPSDIGVATQELVRQGLLRREGKGKESFYVIGG